MNPETVQKCTMTFDDEESKGTVVVERCGWGASIKVDGRDAAFVDLFPPAVDDGPPQILFHDPDDDEPLVKVVLDPAGKLYVCINRNAIRAAPTPGVLGIRYGDAFYTMPHCEEPSDAPDR